MPKVTVFRYSFRSVEDSCKWVIRTPMSLNDDNISLYSFLWSLIQLLKKETKKKKGKEEHQSTNRGYCVFPRKEKTVKRSNRYKIKVFVAIVYCKIKKSPRDGSQHTKAFLESRIRKRRYARVDM